MATYAVLTSSDLGARGQRIDTSGDAIVEIMSAAGHELADRAVLPDEVDQLAEQLANWCDTGAIGVVLTTGGTGLGPRDVMPEATARVLEFEIPGIPEAMRSQTLTKTPMAMISRSRAGARGRTLIVNLPGSPTGVRETLEVVLPVLDTLSTYSGIGTQALTQSDWRERGSGPAYLHDARGDQVGS